MTAHQRAVALFVQHGPMSAKDFAPTMWPTVWKYCESPVRFCTEAGYFLAEMRRLGMLRRNGQRKYYAWRAP